jgi:hypothetical protein
MTEEEELAELRVYKPAEVARMLNIPDDCNWSFVAEVFSRAADGIRAGAQVTIGEETRARWCDGRAERAGWLSGQPLPVRRLALRVWAADNGRLGVTEMAVVTAGVLAAPAERHGPGSTSSR